VKRSPLNAHEPDVAPDCSRFVTVPFVQSIVAGLTVVGGVELKFKVHELALPPENVTE